MAYDVSSVAMFYVQFSLIRKLIILYFLCRRALMLLIVFLITEFHISKTLTTVDQIIPWDGSSTRSLLAKGSTGRGDENLLSLLCAEEAFLDNLIWPGALPAPVDNDRHCCVIYRIWQTPWGIFYPWSIREGAKKNVFFGRPFPNLFTPTPHPAPDCAVSRSSISNVAFLGAMMQLRGSPLTQRLLFWLDED